MKDGIQSFELAVTQVGHPEALPFFGRAEVGPKVLLFELKHKIN